jgi:hypothetical protein
MNTNRPPFLRRYRGRAQAAPVQAGVARIIGALTPDGMGDIPITGSSIVSGNGAGHFRVAGGAIVANTTGTSAGFNAGPYTLTTNDGQVFNITMVPNAYSIGKQSDFGTSGGAGTGVGKLGTPTLNGKRIIGRPGLSMVSGIDGGFNSPLRNTNFGDVGTSWAGVTVESEDYANPWTFTDQPDITSRYLSFKGISVTIPSTSTNAAGFTLDGTVSFPVTDIVFDSCQVIGATKDVNSNAFAAGGDALWANGRGFTDNGDVYVSNIRVIGCTIKYAYRAIVIPCRAAIDASAGNLVSHPLHIAGNYIYGFYEHGCNVSFTASNSTLTVEDNVFDTIVGLSTDLNNPHPDIFFSQATTATADITINYHRNFHFVNGRASGGVNARNMAAGEAYIFKAIGNVFVAGSSEGAMQVVDARDNVFLYNACLAYDITDSNTLHAWLFAASAGPQTQARTSTHRQHLRPS